MNPVFSEFGMLLPAKCIWGHDKLIEASVIDIIDIVSKVDPVTFWISHPIEEMKHNCDLMKIFMLWPILMNNSGSSKKKIVQPNIGDCTEMNIKELNYVELLEDLADLAKKVAHLPHFIDEIMDIGTKMEKTRNKTKNCCIADAMNWVLSINDQNVYKKLETQEGLRNRALQTFFTEYVYCLNKMGMECRTLVESIQLHLCPNCEKASECHKVRGNEAFANGQFGTAVEEYSAAIKYSPDNHILFSNRALCFIRMGIYEKALSDGKKSVVLKNTWPKGHYRFCEALFLLGETDRAVVSNKKAQKLCRDYPEGIRDLIQQHCKIQAAGMKSKKYTKKRHPSEKRLDAQFGASVDSKESNNIFTNTVTEDPPVKESTNESGLENKDCSDNVTGQQQKKGKARKTGGESDKLRASNINTDSKETQKALPIIPPQIASAGLQDKVKNLVCRGYEALNDKRCRNAEGIFSQLLELLDQTELQSLRLTKIDYVVLQYGHANALLGIGQCVELTRAEDQFKDIIQQYSKEKFNCLAFYGIGNVYLRQNRFSDALNQYVKSKTMLKHKMVPGVLTWPASSVVLEESRPETLQVLLDNRIEECKFPPKPNAVCRYEQCSSLPKTQIYFTDPDFKGFIRMVCCQYCRVEFHVCCWKRLKSTKYSDKNDKDFLKYSCLTPDCRGLISHIVIYDSSAQVKCEFEDKTLKKKEPQKPAVKHRGTSKKMKMKPENKAERKKAIEEVAVGMTNENKDKHQEAILSGTVVTNGFRMTRDPLLSQVLMYQEVIRRGCPSCFPEFWESVAAWRVISRQELDDLDRITSSQPTFNKINNLLNHLYKLNDSVKTRIFLYLLQLHCGEINAELFQWVNIVNIKGLEAAKEFRQSNAECLKTINFADVINLWNETYGKNINSVMLDYASDNLFETLSSMRVEHFRCFIWFLEENRQIASVAGLEKELDKYFQETDVPQFGVPRQSFPLLSNKSMKIKTKHKKKKRNQPKATYKLSGAVSTRSQDDDIFTEENTLSLLDPYEPFLPPEILRRDVDEFENLYRAEVMGDRYQEPFDDSTEPIRETLYEYFTQILEEHGPLKLDDEILIGQYKDFPAETHRMVDAAGGLKNFLLESGEFIMVDDMLALSIYDISYDEFGERPQLNPVVQEFKPLFNDPIPDNVDLYCGATHLELPDFHSEINCLKYPHLYNRLDPISLLALDFEMTRNAVLGLTSITHQGDDMDEILSITSSGSGSSCIDHDVSPHTSIPLSQEKPYTEQLDQSNHLVPSNNEKWLKNIQTAIVSVQVDIEFSQHEVNTDPLQPFETQQGDILRMEKEHIVLRNQLKEATEKYEHLQSRYQEEISGLKGQIKSTVERNKITKVELCWIQQDHENEIKKWQQERKENQDKLKTLKNKIKMTNEAIEKCSRSIEEKKRQYETYIEDFLKIHYSRFEDKKAKVEKHIGKCQEERQESIERSIAAEITVLEQRKQGEILKLRIKASTAERSINMLKAVSSSSLASTQSSEQIASLESVLLKLNMQMNTFKSLFDEKMNLVKNGAKLNSLPEEHVTGIKSPPSALMLHSPPPGSPTPAPKSPNPLPAPAKPSNPVLAKSPMKKAAASKKMQSKEADKTPTLPPSNSKPKNQAPVPAKLQRVAGQDRRGNVPPDARQQSPAKLTLFDKIIEELHNIFPDYKSVELTNFIKDFRVRNNGTLSGLTHEEIISRVTEHILDNPARSLGPSSPKPAGGNVSKPGLGGCPSPQPKQPWRVVTGGAKNKWQTSNESESSNEDPCIICHDELKQFPVHRLDCGHRFHKDCIKKWLNTQSTCPTCRDHALLPEDFPVLSGRMRTA